MSVFLWMMESLHMQPLHLSKEPRNARNAGWPSHISKSVAVKLSDYREAV